ncbi:type II toxin-antitoxin system RelE/ParE family toxin [Sphingomonas crocodyli]|uniref:Type II toxin-antitoxin system RelE/ParE family toxin n=1 Tax=Sphingomonas crocodyli TaxID=1979270 RepID=A0A437LUR6_9SPHN|nr:type II toxin-antitoxin system RelE/ParE family toxin [Sphingomonas crocodyli]RVT89107.1 type II toxin-antitoxin system RelE/ParE family toxin [Sphingomonas crocodyli]
MIVQLTAAALDDLRDIGDFIGRDDLDRADRFITDIYATCNALIDFPSAYPLIARYESSGIRRRVHGNYLIFYRVAADAVTILRVLHGARDYEAILFPD